ncbi:synaptonemal complex protein 1-like [Poecilia latipinna]|uniref:synaptonemal complex protein 1-like n=1 Tax=Poecilia latipinna TaxID=48699 RepID=UPI00072EE0F9|nr:PREDICTED: synaptonemal complex protein 1-like [Poecilia latipinna]XP_014892218.1 PREDICTED: synaptonemal complex protein 1-like [Poecilia latipinna]
MSDTPRYGSGEMEPHLSNPEDLFTPAYDALLEEIQQLSSLLEIEIAGRCEDNKKRAHLEAELEETKQELEREKAKWNQQLKCKYEIDIMVLQERIIEERKDHLKKSEEDMALIDNLRATNAVLQENQTKEIQFLQGDKKRLQKKFNDMKHSYHEFIGKYESDVSELNREVERYKQEVSQLKYANLETVEENQKLINDLRAEKEELLQNMTGEITILNKREKYILNELDQVHFSYKELKIKYENDVKELQQQAETYKHIIKQRETDLSEREEKEKLIEAELEKFKDFYLEQNNRYETDVTALKQQAEKYQQEMSCIKEELRKAKEDQLLQDREDKNNTTVLKEEEDSQNLVGLIKDTKQEVSSEKEFLAESLPGCSTDLEPEETETTGETILEDLDNKAMDGKKKKSKFSIWKKICSSLGFKKPKK